MLKQQKSYTKFNSMLIVALLWVWDYVFIFQNEFNKVTVFLIGTNKYLYGETKNILCYFLKAIL